MPLFHDTAGNFEEFRIRGNVCNRVFDIFENCPDLEVYMYLPVTRDATILLQCRYMNHPLKEYSVSNFCCSYFSAMDFVRWKNPFVEMFVVCIFLLNKMAENFSFSVCDVN